MALFDIPNRGGREADLSVAKKSKSKAKTATITVKDGGGIAGKISTIVSMVEKNLGKYRESSLIITDEEILCNYINHSIENGYIAIDTETTGLDPLQDELVGICIYTPNEKTAYIPVNHKSYITGMKAPNQLSVDILHREFNKLKDTCKVIMFNAPFDIRFLKSGIDVHLECYWDCYLGTRLLNENEGAGNNGLKKLHQKYVLNGVGDAFKFDDLFKGITFDKIPIDTGSLYASHDAIITYELFEYQRPFLTADNEECKKRGLQDVAWVFHNIEMPIVDVCVAMEDNGVFFDAEYAKELSVKYNAILDDKVQTFYDICNRYAKSIDGYRMSVADCKLDDPINIASSTQIAVLLYDILGVEAVDPKNPRGTGVEILSKIDHPIAKAILEYREVSKLLSTYIDKLPKCVNPKDGRVHCKFNQYGADTGRFSSNDPNMQNIPSHNHDIRKMFTASDGYVLMSSDFSQQENCECFTIDRWCEVETVNGWQYADRIVVGDVLKTKDDFGKDTTITVNKIFVDKNHITYYY